MNKLKLFILLLFVSSLALTACDGGGDTNTGGDDQTTTQDQQDQQNQQDQSSGIGGNDWESDIPDDEREELELTVTTVGNTMSEMNYDQETITIKENNKVKLTLVNEATDAAMIHNFVLVVDGAMEEVAMESLQKSGDEYVAKDNDNVIAYTSLAGPGETVEVEFNAPKKGTYKFVCTYPGHWQQMNGTLIVE